MANNKLQPIPRLIGRILAYNICHKTGSYNYYSWDLATCVYAIIPKLEARVMFDTLVKNPSTFLPCGAFLTRIFRKCKVNLASESNVVKIFEPFELIDQFFVWSCWKHCHHILLFVHTVLTEHPNHPLLCTSPHTDAFYNSLSAEILDIKTKQTSMMESQTSFINNQNSYFGTISELKHKDGSFGHHSTGNFALFQDKLSTTTSTIWLRCDAQARWRLQCISSRIHEHCFFDVISFM